jgi:hypothetical protein
MSALHAMQIRDIGPLTCQQCGQTVKSLGLLTG